MMTNESLQEIEERWFVGTSLGSDIADLLAEVKRLRQKDSLDNTDFERGVDIGLLAPVDGGIHLGLSGGICLCPSAGCPIHRKVQP